MKAIDVLKQRYPMFTDEELKDRHCVKGSVIKDLPFEKCLSFEYCDDCWNQELPNENK